MPGVQTTKPAYAGLARLPGLGIVGSLEGATTIPSRQNLPQVEILPSVSADSCSVGGPSETAKPDSKSYRPSGRHAKQDGRGASARNERPTLQPTRADRERDRGRAAPRFPTACRAHAPSDQERSTRSGHVAKSAIPNPSHPARAAEQSVLYRRDDFVIPPKGLGSSPPWSRTPRASTPILPSSTHRSTRPDQNRTPHRPPGARGLNRPTHLPVREKGCLPAVRASPASTLACPSSTRHGRHRFATGRVVRDSPRSLPSSRRGG